MQCKVCKSHSLKMFLSLGTTPLANNFLRKEDLGKAEPRFPLEVCFCNDCKLVQLSSVVDPKMMFINYVYVTSTTATFKKHFDEMAEHVTSTMKLPKGSVVVDIGSNDGLLLGYFQQRGMTVVGVEPAVNIAKIANENGVETINAFFDENSVNQIISKRGKASVVTATNVFAHIEDIDGVIKNVKNLLTDNGAYVVEFQYLLDTVTQMTFDNVYHEHIYYYTVLALKNIFQRHGMEIFHVKHVDSHGGSIRMYVQKQGGGHVIDPSVNEYIQKERQLGLDKYETFEAFGKTVIGIKEKIVRFVKDSKAQGKKIAAYGAPAKGNTLLNFCGIDHNYIDYVVDDNPLKQNLYTPGTHIPVASSKMLEEKTPDYILILAWNFASEILSKTQKYKERGVKFIIPLPEPRVV